ncbi:hypothetical protein RND81_09G035600 [Saponaria officinalis]|uniref:Endonuclease/exonuclease/phosphatase domain-containing protein n=1 Tax=Saponaria officinalis TaxID=3572 RepID=A0AAW1IIB7_SAPOF
MTQRNVLVTFVYAMNRASERIDLWDQLRVLSSDSLPWICLGDFNVSLTLDERMGCVDHEREMQEFRDCLSDCLLEDHPYTGGIFTWHNKQDSCPKWAKLDRLLDNRSWFLQVPSTVAFLPAGVSDHAHILLTVVSLIALHRPFRYLNCWSLSAGFTEIVSSVWQAPAHGGSSFGMPISSSILPDESLSVGSRKGAPADLQNFEECRMRVLAQKAKVQHLQLSDANTKYFYARIAARKIRNTIGAIDDMYGQPFHGHDKVSSAFMEFYTSLLGSTEEVVSPPTDLFSSNILRHPEHLNAAVNVHEIQSALSSIDRNKSPGVDGFSSGFFRDSWATIGHDFVAAVQEFFQSCYA